MIRPRQILWAVLLLTLSSTAIRAEKPIDYASQIKPLLEAKCFACHGALKQESGLRLDAASLIFAGGDSGAVIVPTKPEESILLERVAAADEEERMPPEGEGEALTPEQLKLVTEWINQGAAAPKDEPIPADPHTHWAYQSAQRRDFSGSAADQIDALLFAHHARVGVQSQPESRKHVLLRRLHLDLVGLPPSREALHAFLSDDSPQAYERVVDQLLASPEYGERWGRHWMDVWRYSDWAGFGAEIRYSQKNIWRWRDWIIESLNSDRGYDEMLVAMLAADEQSPSDASAIRATGFLARNWYKFDRNVWLDDTIEHTGRAFLGVTFKCTRCHDHKYDPITQQEYFQMRAVFEPYQVRTDPLAGEEAGLARVYDADLSTETFLFERGDPKQPVKEHPINPGAPAVLPGQLDVSPVELPLAGYYPAMRDGVAERMIASAQTDVSQAKTAWKQAQAKLAALPSAERTSTPSPAASPAAAAPPDAVFLDDTFAQESPKTWRTVRGDWKYQGGSLHQTKVIGAFSPMVTQTDHPGDFVAQMRFTPTGGSNYRSVGFSFDWVDDRDFQAVYLSANDRRPTVSAFHRTAGADAYPAEAVVTHEIKVGQESLLEAAVKGNVLNLLVDGKLKLAYRLPVTRQKGKFAIWTYDATAQFHHLRITSLPSNRKLVPPNEPTPADSTASAREVEQAATLAWQKLAVAEAKLASLDARVAAEQVKYASPQPPSDQLAPLALAAGRAERQLAVAEAEHALLIATHAKVNATATAAAGDDKSTAAAEAAEKKLVAAQAALDKTIAAAAEESSTYKPLGGIYPKKSSGRRLALAKWIADESNPLTARVAVNHIWMRHFGAPLVESVDDFGLRAPQPELADVLDFLAVELMEHDWSMKHLHRLLVTSKAYRMSSAAQAACLEKDPDNKLFWRISPRRMEAETVRDSILFVAGVLDSTRGGPEIDSKQGQTTLRRSIYFQHARDRQMQFLQMFDAANPRECYRRKESVRPQQAFAMVNSSMALAQARRLAAALCKDFPTGDASADNAFIDAAFETVLSRTAQPQEREECLKFLTLQAKQLAEPATLQLLGNAPNPAAPAADPQIRARENLVLVLFSHNDFLTIR